MQGYAKIGWRMAVHPELAIFRRFAALNAQSLLYMQAELLDLETKLRKQGEDDLQSENEKTRWYARDWRSLSRLDREEGENAEQWKMCLEIREKLQAYSK